MKKEIERTKGVIEKAKSLTLFIYARHKTLAIMRKYTMKRDIVILTVTRFASSFLTLESLMEKKDKLRLMFLLMSGELASCQSVKSKLAAATMLKCSFWSGVNMVL